VSRAVKLKTLYLKVKIKITDIKKSSVKDTAFRSFSALSSLLKIFNRIIFKILPPSNDAMGSELKNPIAKFIAEKNFLFKRKKKMDNKKFTITPADDIKISVLGEV
jgi:hypothetical protein